MRKGLYLLLSAIPLFLAGGISGLYIIKTLSVLAFAGGSVIFLWSAIQHAVRTESDASNKD